VHRGELSEGHARALLALENDDAIMRLSRQAVAGGWSVREIEERVRGEGRTTPAARRRRESKALAPDARRVEDVLRKRLGTDVKVHPRRRSRGFLTIQYYSNDDLSRLLELILGEPYGG
jgi:ParB family chromosome partitioning protein